jgi:hypothetical protein
MCHSSTESCRCVHNSFFLFLSTSAKILSSCVMRELQELEPGVGGGLLLLAACTDGPLLLVQQARKSMSQPAECAVN